MNKILVVVVNKQLVVNKELVVNKQLVVVLILASNATNLQFVLYIVVVSAIIVRVLVVVVI